MSSNAFEKCLDLWLSFVLVLQKLHDSVTVFVGVKSERIDQKQWMLICSMVLTQTPLFYHSWVFHMFMCEHLLTAPLESAFTEVMEESKKWSIIHCVPCVNMLYIYFQSILESLLFLSKLPAWPIFIHKTVTPYTWVCKLSAFSVVDDILP